VGKYHDECIKRERGTHVVDLDSEGGEGGGISSDGLAGRTLTSEIDPGISCSETTYNPDLKPEVPSSLVKPTQGFEKLDWVTVWFLGLNSKVTVSLMAAWMFDGL
jgi:hypothetical protein